MASVSNDIWNRDKVPNIGDVVGVAKKGVSAVLEGVNQPSNGTAGYGKAPDHSPGKVPDKVPIKGEYKEHDKDHGKDYDKDYDKEPVKGRDKDHDKDKDHGKDHDKDYDKEPVKGHDKDHDKDKDHGKDHDKDYDKEPIKGHDKDHDKDKDHGKDHDKDYDKEPVKGHDKDHDKDKDHGKDHDKDYDKEPVKGHDKDHDKGHDGADDNTHYLDGGSGVTIDAGKGDNWIQFTEKVSNLVDVGSETGIRASAFNIRDFSTGDTLAFGQHAKGADPRELTGPVLEGELADVTMEAGATLEDMLQTAADNVDVDDWTTFQHSDDTFVFVQNGTDELETGDGLIQLVGYSGELNNSNFILPAAV